MGLFATVTKYLSDKLLPFLAEASAMPLAAAQQYAPTAVGALVVQLALATDADELNARWDMCRQLYVSQLLTETDELLRTDLGWPDRRRYLAQKILGAAQVRSLTENAPQPAQAATLLGYLTIITLAVVGEQSSVAELDPAGLGAWLEAQKVPAQASPQPATTAPQPALRTSAPSQKAAQPTGSSQKIKVISTLGVLGVAGLIGGYFLLGQPANASGQAAQPTTESASATTPAAAETSAVPAAPVPTVAEAAPASAPALAVAATPAAAAKAAPTRAAATTAVLRDTIGNAALARQIGGKFNVALGRYPKGEGQPLIVKLANRATLTVGINSTESLLYKRLVNPSLPRPTDIAIDRLTFDLGQARLGAEGAQQLGNVASLLKTFPKARLLVMGHANNKEMQAIRLGLQRATVVVDELVKQGISADRLQGQGMLATELPTDDDSPEKQAMLQGISLRISRL